MAANGIDNWKPQKLEEVCAQITDGKHGDCQDQPDSGYYFLSCKDVANGKLNYEGARQITEADFHDTHRRTKFAPADVLITNSGTIGRMAIAPDIELTRRTTFQKSVAILKPIASRVESNFLYYALQADIRRLIEYAGGTAQKNLLLRDLRAFEVNVPPLPIQRRIAGILSAYDELIENSQRRIKILESMARALYREWFVHFRFPGHEHHPRVPSPLGEIPKGWEVKKLGDLCELRKDTYKDSDHSGLPLLDMARMPSRTLAPSDTGSPSELTTSRILFQKGDTLFGAIRCYLHKVVAAHYPGVTNTSVLVLRSRSPSFRSLVAIVASDIDTIRWAETQSTGTKMPVINWGVFQGMPAPIPSKTLAQAFEDIAGPMLDEIGSLAPQVQNLRRTRDLLLPRLLSGQVELRPNGAMNTP